MDMQTLEVMQKIDRACNDLPECKRKEIKEHLRTLQLLIGGYPV